MSSELDLSQIEARLDDVRPEMVKPAGSYILAKALDGDKLTNKPDGIHLPSGVGGWNFSVIVSCGPGVIVQTGIRIPVDYKPGQIIMHRGERKEIQVRGEVLSLVSHHDILGVIDDRGDYEVADKA